MYRCPECGSTDLRIETLVICRFEQRKVTGIELSIPVGADPQWDHESLMLCANDDCGYTGEADRFYQA